MLVNHKKILLGFAFFSGFAALLYETIWLREMHLIFGVSFYALSTVFSAFLGGLVLGSYFSGRFIDKFTSLKKIAGIYGFVELFIGVGALMVPLLLDGLTPSLSFFHNLNINLFMFNFIRFILAGFVLLIPTFFIGATFPIILRLYTETRGEIKEGISLLYFINTLGGVFGVIIAGFFLIRFFGMRFTLYLGVLINLIIMGFAFRISKNYGEEKIEDYGVPDSDKEEYSKKIKFVLFLFFISGFTALAYEVIWGRLLVLYLYGTTYAASALLIIFLLGISLGSLIYSRFFKNANLRHFAYLEMIIAFFSVLGLYIYPIFPKVQVLGFGTSFGVLFLITSVLIFIPTLCFGIVFPLISEYVLRRSNKIGSRMGILYSVNTFGALLGAFFAGFLFIPFFGLKSSLLIVSFLGLIISFFALFLNNSKKKDYFYLGFAILMVLVLSFNIPDKFFSFEYQGTENIDYREGRSATVGVQNSAGGKYKTISVDNQVVAGDEPVLAMDSKVLAHLPLLLHKNPETALTVGFGSGGTSYSMLTHNLDSVDVVEIEQKVIDVAGYFDSLNHGILEDDKLNVIIDDARSYLTLTDKKYDVISTDVTNIKYRSNSNLYTKEYFELIKSRLNDGGIVSAWIPVLGSNEEEQKILMKTFSDVFPETSIWYFYNKFSFYVVYIGSSEKLEINYRDYIKRFNEEKVRKDLKEVGLNEYNFLNSLFLDSEAVKNYVLDSEIHTDNKPILEFYNFKLMLNATVSGNNLIALLERKIDPLKYINKFDSMSQGGEFLRGFRYEQEAIAKPLITGHIIYLQGRTKDALPHYALAVENADYLDTIDGIRV